MKSSIHGSRGALVSALISLAALVPASIGSAQSVATFLGPEIASRLEASGKVLLSSSGAPGLLPLHPAANAMREAILGEKPSILVETLFSIPRAQSSTPAARTAELASIYGVLRSIGSLQGIEYYSASRKTMRTFYAESYLVAGPDGKSRISDPPPPVAGAIPGSETLFAFQRDLSFGSNLYRYEFASYPNAIEVKTSNLTRMSYGPVPVLAPQALSTRLLVIQADDAILFYAESGASAPGLFKGKLEDSFSNRAEALFKWFSARFSGLAR